MSYDKNTTVKLLQVVFLSYAYAVLLAYRDRSNPYLACTLVYRYMETLAYFEAVCMYNIFNPRLHCTQIIGTARLKLVPVLNFISTHMDTNFSRAGPANWM